MMKREDDRRSRARPLRLFAMVFVPVLLLAGGALGYGWLTGEPGHAGKRKGVRAHSIRLAHRGPVRPRYGRGGFSGRGKRARVAPLVETRRVRLGSWVLSKTFHGRVQAGHVLEVRMPVSGRVVAVHPHLRTGGYVRKGDVLLRVDDLSYRMAVSQARATLEEIRGKIREIKAQLAMEEASLQNARQQLEVAKRDLQRMERLQKSGTASSKALDEAILAVAQRRLAVMQKEGAVRIARARLDQYRAQLQKQQAALELAQRNLADTVYAAPFDARVVSAQVEKGQYVTPADRLFTLSAIRSLKVKFSISEDQYGDLLAAQEAVIGLPVKIVWRSGSLRRVFSGKIERTAPQLDENTGLLAVFSSLQGDESGLHQIPLGAFVDVVITVASSRKVARLPESALHENDTVFVVENGRLKSRPVRVLARAGGELIVADGVREGEEILSSPMPNARDGMHVRKAKP